MNFACMHSYLLDIPRQPTCMKLGTGGLYKPLLDIPRHPTCMGTSGLGSYILFAYRDIQQICCSTQTGQHSPMQGSCCPVWVLQHTYTCIIHTHIHNYIAYILTHTPHTYTDSLLIILYMHTPREPIRTYSTELT